MVRPRINNMLSPQVYTGPQEHLTRDLRQPILASARPVFAHRWWGNSLSPAQASRSFPITKRAKRFVWLDGKVVLLSIPGPNQGSGVISLRFHRITARFSQRSVLSIRQMSKRHEPTVRPERKLSIAHAPGALQLRLLSLWHPLYLVLAIHARFLASEVDAQPLPSRLPSLDHDSPVAPTSDLEGLDA